MRRPTEKDRWGSSLGLKQGACRAGSTGRWTRQRLASKPRSTGARAPGQTPMRDRTTEDRLGAPYRVVTPPLRGAPQRFQPASASEIRNRNGAHHRPSRSSHAALRAAECESLETLLGVHGDVAPTVTVDHPIWMAGERPGAGLGSPCVEGLPNGVDRLTIAANTSRFPV